MARARKGTLLKTRDGRWQGQVTLIDGSRYRLKPFPKGTSEAYARERTAFWAEEVIRRGVRLRDHIDIKHEPEVHRVDDGDLERWLIAWYADRGRRLGSRDKAPRHYKNHIDIATDGKHVRDWSCDDLRALVAELDRKAQGDIYPPRLRSTSGRR